MGEWRYSSTHSLTSALGGSEWSASRPSRFTPRKRDPGTHWIGGWLGLRAVLDAVVKRKIPIPLGNRILETWSSARSPVAIPTELSRLLIIIIIIIIIITTTTTTTTTTIIIIIIIIIIINLHGSDFAKTCNVIPQELRSLSRGRRTSITTNITQKFNTKSRNGFSLGFKFTSFMITSIIYILVQKPQKAYFLLT
jgi:hypothetical protein